MALIASFRSSVWRAAMAVAVALIVPAGPAFAHSGHSGHLSRAQVTVIVIGGVLLLVGSALLILRRTNTRTLYWLSGMFVIMGLIVANVGPVAVAFLEDPCRGRPATTARLEVVQPQDGMVLGQWVPVEVRIVDERPAPPTAQPNHPGEGHLHIAVDGQIVSMIGLESQRIRLPLGLHYITIEYVAKDHAAFCPPVSVVRRIEIVSE